MTVKAAEAMGLLIRKPFLFKKPLELRFGARDFIDVAVADEVVEPLPV